MSQWPSTKAKRVLAALLSIGWVIKRQSGSHRTLCRSAGLILFLHFTIVKKSALVCLLEYPNILGLAQMTYKL
nr:type II toxin-antitoxin system HicA family toxin [Methylocucumis oryzae]